MNLLNATTLPEIQAQVFVSEWLRGHLWVPKDVSHGIADLLSAIARATQTDALTVHVDTNNGMASVWGLAEALIHCPAKTVALVGAEAKSAGLIIACSCEKRVCSPNTVFLYHGSPYKSGAEDDRKKAEWFARRTTAPLNHWLHMAQTGQDYAFGPEQALEWGVVHEVIA